MIAVEPTSVQELSEFVRSGAAENAAIMPIGSATTLGLGNPAERCDATIRMRGLRRIVEYIAEDQVVVVEAGITLGELQPALARHGQRLALDPPASDEMTIGGMLAGNTYGPSALRYGTLKDLIVGIEIVRADGAVARAGGKVVKNVAGFDVSKLMVGSLGTLAIITKATFRLHPLPEARRALAFTAPTAQVFAFVLALREAQLEPSSIVALVNGSASRVEVTFEGFTAGVEAQAERSRQIAERMAVFVIPSGASATSGVEGQPKYRLKGTYPPAEFARVAAEVDSAVVYPSLGVLSFDGPSTPSGAQRSRGTSVDDVLGLRRFFESIGGTLVVHDMPEEWHGKIDAWGTPPPSLRLMQALKERFDPTHRLSPGRFVGGI
jgi:glycolate oxidase FAD binding subunit